jgi:hypothetical protein
MCTDDSCEPPKDDERHYVDRDAGRDREESPVERENRELADCNTERVQQLADEHHLQEPGGSLQAVRTAHQLRHVNPQCWPHAWWFCQNEVQLAPTPAKLTNQTDQIEGMSNQQPEDSDEIVHAQVAPASRPHSTPEFQGDEKGDDDIC